VEGVGLKTLERLVAGTGARALVAPHFYGAGVLGRYKESNPRAFSAVVLTDYVPNAIGVPPNLDLYVVADEAAADAVVGLGVPEEKIHPTGIPIDPAFEEPADPGGVRRELLKLEDDDLPIVLVMGGGLGGGVCRFPRTSRTGNPVSEKTPSRNRPKRGLSNVPSVDLASIRRAKWAEKACFLGRRRATL
jgi:Monogalactosyldiacylglycerol (MGDG) synthase